MFIGLALDGDPRTLPPVRIVLVMQEPQPGAWDADMVAALEDIILCFRTAEISSGAITCAWNEEKESFDPARQFLDSGPAVAGAPRGDQPDRLLQLYAAVLAGSTA